MLLGTAAAIAVVGIGLTGTAAQAATTVRPLQVYGYYGNYGACVASGKAGIIGGAWKAFNCLKVGSNEYQLNVY